MFSAVLIFLCYQSEPAPAAPIISNQPPADQPTGPARTSVSDAATIDVAGNPVEPFSPIEGIELAPRVEIGDTVPRSSDMPSTGLSRSG